MGLQEHRKAEGIAYSAHLMRFEISCLEFSLIVGTPC